MRPLAAEAVGQQIEKQTPAVTLRKEADEAERSLRREFVMVESLLNEIRAIRNSHANLSR
jgi:hypothetical protein